MYQFGQASYRKLTVYSQNNEPAIEIGFPAFWSSTGTFVYNGQSYSFTPHSILLTKVDFKRASSQIGEIDFDWKMGGTIKIENVHGMTKMFTIKGGSLVKRSYEVKDFLTNHLLTIRHSWNWSRFNYDYKIESGKDVADDENNVDFNLLVIASLYASYLISKKRRRRRNA
jgi:hypothetical protein